MRGVVLERSPHATLRPHGLAGFLHLAQAGLKYLVVAVVDDVIQGVALRRHDAGVVPVQLVLREAGVWHDRLPLVTIQRAYDSTTTGC